MCLPVSRYVVSISIDHMLLFFCNGLSGRKAMFLRVQDCDMVAEESRASQARVRPSLLYALALYLVLRCLPWRLWLCQAGCVGSHSQLSPWKGKEHEMLMWCPQGSLICGFTRSTKLPSSFLHTLLVKSSQPMTAQRAHMASRSISLPFAKQRGSET